MTTAEARQLVQKTFQNPFDKGQFVYFIKNLLNTIDESKAFHAHGYVYEKYRDKVKTYERIGTYTDPKGNKIDILIVYLQKESSIDRARTTLRNFVGDYLKKRGEKEAGLVAFVSPNQKDWRFSLVKMEYKIIETPTGRVKAKEEFTPAKRYSFLVGAEENSHTAQSRLVPILEDDTNNPTLKDIEEAFNIEKVTKEFFEKYRELFLKVKEAMDKLLENDKKIKSDFEANSVNTVDFSKKLLGQIVFLYFLQKKGWFGVKRGEVWGSGSKNFLRELFDKKHGDYKNFFNDILEPLFYEALRNDRSHDDHYFSMFKCKIPFLNGGLFDPINNYDWKETDIILPNDLFSNDYLTKEKDKGTGILDIFDRYNFTVKEDEPLEKEVAVDPEMLGKVFENLLEVKDRKSKGTYYTPREIVHYMCQESLVNYLATELEGKVSKGDIETLIKYGETVVENDSRVANKGRETERYFFKLPESIRKHAKLIDEKIASIRVCDPAVGSGAFPVGMMNEIVRTRNALTPYIGKDGERTPYHFKRHAIQNCLYGVDIDPGAVEIAKLRLWLSLVVDEEDIKKIKPLPNLDYKIMQGNSLIELITDSITADNERNKIVKQTKQFKDDLFNTTSPQAKQKIKNEIDRLIYQLFEYDRTKEIENLRQKIRLIQSQGRLFEDKKSQAEDEKKIRELEDKIKDKEQIKVPGPSEHFEWHINFSEVFAEKGGFDVVIANPPYNVVKDEVYRKRFADSIYGRANLYGLFIHQSVRSIVKPNGHLTFINPKTLLADKYFINLRKFLRNNGRFKTILKIADRHKVFENVLQAVIVHIFQRQTAPDPNTLILMHEIRTKSDIENLDSRLAIEASKIWLGDRFSNCLIVSDKIEIYSIFQKLIQGTKSLEQVGIKFETGKIQWDLFKERLIPVPMPGSVRIIWAENIQRYRFSVSTKRAGKEFINGKLSIAPNIRKKTIITQRTTADEQEYRIIATIFDPQMEGFDAFSENNTNYMVKCPQRYALEFVLGLLNSKFFDVLFRHINSNTHVSSGELNSLPIHDFSVKNQRPIIKLVNKILDITKDDDYLENPAKQAKVRDLEKQIDQLVYKLYGLTPEEIKVVENNN